MYRPMRVWWLLFLPPYECVVFTVFTALRECGGYYIYRLPRQFIYHSIYALCVVTFTLKLLLVCVLLCYWQRKTKWWPTIGYFVF